VGDFLKNSFNIKLVYTSNIINVSLTYLEIAEPKEEDMPSIKPLLKARACNAFFSNRPLTRH